MLTAEGLQPSAGEIAAQYERLGGKVLFVGKPYAAMYAYASKLIPDVAPARILAVEDSLEHDVRGGQEAGFASALVLTGISAGLTRSELQKRISHYRTVPNFVLPKYFGEGRAW